MPPTMMLYDMNMVYLLVMVGTLAITLLAQAWVKLAYAKYSKMPNLSRMTGAEAAAEMLRREGMTVTFSETASPGTVAISHSRGFLSDHYDPSAHVIRLSPDVYNGQSVAALAIACHEAGHALQHEQAYAWLKLRSLSVPLASLGNFGPLICIIGIALDAMGLVLIGLALFAAILLFQFITLPVEFDASHRARLAIARNGMAVNREEEAGVSKVLTAAAMTYVAAMVATLMWLLYYAWRAGLLGGNRRN